MDASCGTQPHLSPAEGGGVERFCQGPGPGAGVGGLLVSEAQVSGLRDSQAEDLLTPCPPVHPAGSWDAGLSTQTPRWWPRVKAEKVKLDPLNPAPSPQASWSPGGTG